MASAIEDVGSLRGKTLNDQEGQKVGEIKDVYGIGDESNPMWITVESSTGLSSNRMIFVPIARVKEEDGEVRVPYSTKHVQDSPEVEASDELSEEDDRMLRDYYAIDHADFEVRSDNDSYAAQVPDAEGQPRKL